MTTAQVKEVEEIANELVHKNVQVYARETPLAQAKSIQGLRAIFDEVSQREGLDSLRLLTLD